MTLRLGALFPMFLIYENPGPMVGVSLGWRLNEYTQLVARGELGGVFFDGAQRAFGTVGAGIRVSPGPRWLVSPWLQLGLGATGYIERISVALPERTATTVDVGGLITAGISVGARVAQRWEIGVGWDHNIVPWHYYKVYTGTESQPYRGTAMAWIGMKL